METMVMTGATRGIGAVAARRIVEEMPGASMVLLARSTAGLSSLRAEFPGWADVHVVETDLSAPASVSAAAREVLRLVEEGTVARPTALVLNAGIQHVHATTAGPGGFEDTFAVNVLANHVLVRGLAPAMPPGGRIVVTVSDTHFGDLRHNLGMVPGPRWQDPETMAEPGWLPRSETTAAGRTAYSTSKLAAIYQVHAWPRQYPELTVLGYNPGFVPGTGLARDAGPVSRFAMARVLPLLARTPLASTTEAAGHRLADLVTDALPAPTGAYIDRDRVASSSAESYDRVREDRLVQVLDRLALEHGEKI